MLFKQKKPMTEDRISYHLHHQSTQNSYKNDKLAKLATFIRNVVLRNGGEYVKPKLRSGSYHSIAKEKNELIEVLERPIAEISESIKWILSKDVVLLTLEDKNGNIVGMIVAEPCNFNEGILKQVSEAENSDRIIDKIKNSYVIEMFYIDAEYRGNGLGKKLFEHLLRKFTGEHKKISTAEFGSFKLYSYGKEQIPANTLCLIVNSSNLAVKLYERYGFYPLALLEDTNLEGQTVLKLLMVLDLTQV